VSAKDLYPKTPQILNLGLKPYREVWELQKTLQADLIAGQGAETILTCEHLPVITAGRSAVPQNLLTPPAKLKELGIDLVYVERGGDFTYHGPGQLVVYPILDLRMRRRDVAWYMRLLEEVIIKSLAWFELPAFRLKGQTGVWTQVVENDRDSKARKIAALGVRISHWCTMHGFSLNVLNCLDGFIHINPCGLQSSSVTSMQHEKQKAFKLHEVRKVVIKNFLEILGQ